MARKRSDSTGSASINAEIDKVLNELVEGLTDNDDDIRHKAIASVLTVSLPVVRGMVADRLVDLLAGDDDGVRQRAAASLVQLGRTVTAALLLRLQKSQDEAVRDQLMEIITRIARMLPEAEGARIKMDLMISALMGAMPRSARRRGSKRRRHEMIDDASA